MMPRVAIIVLNWNNAPDTIECLQSLKLSDYPASEIVAVDNGSTDDSVALLKQEQTYFTLLEIPQNLGYAEGNNFGIRYALSRGADFIFIVNNDVHVAPDCLSHLVAVAQREPLAGLLGPKVYHREQPHHIQSAGILLDASLRSHHRGFNELDAGQFDNCTEVDAIIGCAMLAKRKALQHVGLLDPSYFMYHEDIDWSCRFRESGYKVIYAPQGKVWHRDSQMRTSDLPRITYYMTRNTYLLLSKQKAGISPKVRVVLQDLIWLINWTLNPKWKHRRAQRDALLKGLLDAVRKHYGKQEYRYGV